jgi:hypothetical protein
MFVDIYYTDVVQNRLKLQEILQFFSLTLLGELWFTLRIFTKLTVIRWNYEVLCNEIQTNPSKNIRLRA